jgi:hypothetical protein
MKTASVLFRLFMFSVCFTSCNDEGFEEANNEALNKQIILDENVMNSELDEVYRISDEAIFQASTAEGREGVATYCATLAHDPETKIITLDFGENGCIDPMGKLRKGMLEIQYTGVAGSLLSGRTITFHNYSVDGKKITGSIITSDFNRNKNGNIEFVRSHKNINITFSDENASFSANSTYLMEWISGEGDLDAYNNVYELSGTAWGVSRSGVKYTSQIVRPVTLQTNCFANSVYYPVSGSSQINPENGKYFRIDFGNGECDKTTTLKIGDKIIYIELP